ncbi:MAG: 4'-phosphopantetheinyl transferase superfamily protein [Spirochaetales bacterium]|nr:4'-phosphopantetheinyl transferase superfamily protein [Spirochaetales bacterium]
MKAEFLDDFLSHAKSQHHGYELYTLELPEWRPLLMELTEFLSAEEKDQIPKKIVSVREQFICGHGILRHLLSQRINRPPQTIDFKTNPWSKPYLSKTDHPQSPYFNISHDKDKVLIGVSENREIGVDIMYIEEKRDILEIAKRYYSKSEQDFLFRQSGFEQYKSFYYIFCQKEALIKAHGQGLSLGLEKFSVEPDPAKKPRVIDYPPQEQLFGRAVLEAPFEITKSIAIVCLVPPDQSNGS